jgi:hypothetical protein
MPPLTGTCLGLGVVFGVFCIAALRVSHAGGLILRWDQYRVERHCRECFLLRGIYWVADCPQTTLTERILGQQVLPT